MAAASESLASSRKTTRHLLVIQRNNAVRDHMNATKKKCRETAGFKVGSVQEFLGRR